MDEEIRNLAGEERRNSCASQSNGCCLDPTVVEQLLTLGAAPAWQQALREELTKMCEVLHQSPATPVHTSGGGDRKDEREEDQRERAANHQLGQPAPGCRNSGFPAGSVFKPARFSRGRFQLTEKRRRTRQTTPQQISHSSSFAPETAAAASGRRTILRKGMEEKGRQRGKKQPGKGPKNLRRKQPGKGPDNI